MAYETAKKLVKDCTEDAVSKRMVVACRTSDDFLRSPSTTDSVDELDRPTLLGFLLKMLHGDAPSPEGECDIVLTGKDGETVAFRGEHLASVSSRTAQGDRSERWRELAIYRDSSGGYVIYAIGRTTIEHETDRYSVDRAESVEAVMDMLVPHKQKPRYMVADLLYAAEEKDRAFLPVLDRLSIEDIEPIRVGSVELSAAGQLIELPRTGDRALRFRGVLIASRDSRFDDGAPSWTEIKIYRVAPQEQDQVTAETTRYVVWKAKCSSESRTPSRAVAWVVPTGLMALRVLIRKGESWLETTGYDALATAAQNDAYFNRTLDNMLKNSRFRQMLSDAPALTRDQRRTLIKLAAGDSLVTLQSPDDNDTVKLVSWAEDKQAQLPAWQVFFGLSRRRLIRRTIRPEQTQPDTLAHWDISDLGRTSLDADSRAQAARSLSPSATRT